MKLYLFFNLKPETEPAEFESWIKNELLQLKENVRGIKGGDIRRVNTVMQGTLKFQYITEFELDNEMAMMMAMLSPQLQGFLKEFNPKVMDATIVKTVEL